MCDVVTALAGASMAMGVFGSVQQGQAQAAAASAQAQQAENNARLSEQQAQDAEHRGKIAVQNKQRETAQNVGIQRSALGASGFDMNSGSSLDVQSDTAMIGAWDALTVQNNAEREAWGFRQQGANYSNSASVLNSTAKNAKTAGLIGAGSSLLSGASQFAGAWSAPVSTATPGGVSGMSDSIFGQARSRLATPKIANTGTTWF